MVSKRAEDIGEFLSEPIDLESDGTPISTKQEIKTVPRTEPINADDIVMWLGDIFEKQEQRLARYDTWNFKTYIADGKFHHFTTTIKGSKWKDKRVSKTDLQRILDELHGELESNFDKMVLLKESFYTIEFRILDGELLTPIEVSWKKQQETWWNEIRVDFIEEVV